MHHSRLCAVLIDCKTSDVDEAARFWADALGRPIDMKHWGSRGNYRMLETPPDEAVVQVKRVDHESRVHLDIETDDIPAEGVRLEKLGAKCVDRLERWVVMQAPTGQRLRRRVGTKRAEQGGHVNQEFRSRKFIKLVVSIEDCCAEFRRNPFQIDDRIADERQRATAE